MADINPDMLAVGRARAAERGLDDAVDFVEANAEALPFPDRSFDAVTIAFGIRNVPRIATALAEAHRVLKFGGRFLCLEFSTVDVPGLAALYDLYSFNVIPALGQAVAGDAESYRYLVESIRRFPRPRGVRRHDARGRLRARLVPADDRRHRRAAFGLAIVIAAFSHLARLARAGFVFAREGVFALLDPKPLPLPARWRCGVARLIERPTTTAARAAARRGADPARPDLCEARPVPGDAAGRGRRRAGARSRIAAGQDAAVPAGRGRAHGRERASASRSPATFVSLGPPVAAASIAQVHRAEVATPMAPAPSPSRCCGPASSGASQADLDAFTFAARKAESLSAEARRLRLIEVVDTLRRSVTIEMDLRLEAAALSEMAENTKDDPDFRVPAVDWDRTARDVLTLEWIDGTPLSDRARLEAKGFDLKALARAVIQTFLRHALRDGFFHADMHPGNLFVDDDGKLVAVDFGIMGRLAPKERRFLAEILYGFITRDYQRTARGAFRGRLRAAPPFGRELRAGDPRHRRADPQPHRRRHLDGASC